MNRLDRIVRAVWQRMGFVLFALALILFGALVIYDIGKILWTMGY